MQIPFCGPTYNGRSVNIDASRCVNFYPELTGTEDNKTRMSLVGTPGTFLFSFGQSNEVTIGSTVFNNTLFIVVKSSAPSVKLYSVNTSGVRTLRGTLTTTTATRVAFANNGLSVSTIGGDQLMIIDGTDGYIYNVTSTVFTKISGGGWPGTPKHVEFIDGYFVIINGALSHYTSNLYDGLTWNGIARGSVIATPDNIRTVINHRQTLFFIKEQSTEVWYNAGVDTTKGTPFARQQGAVYDYGIRAKWSLARGGGSFYFLCTQRIADSGQLIGVAEVTEFSPVLVSPSSINYRIASSTNLDNCFAYFYTESGHSFYVLTNPDDDWTIVYDITTKMWHERSSLMTYSTDINRHVSNCYAFFNNKHIIGDYRNSSLYYMSSEYLNDNGNPIYSYRTAQTIVDINNRDAVFISSLSIDAETGNSVEQSSYIVVTPYAAGTSGGGDVLIKADGSITAGVIRPASPFVKAYLSWSNDAGHTWSDEYPCDVGTVGQYTTRLLWRRLGRARDRVFKLIMKDSSTKILIGANVDASV